MAVSSVAVCLSRLGRAAVASGVAVGLLAGCGVGGTGTAPGIASLSSRAHRIETPSCTVRVYASSLGGAYVQGFSGSITGTPCGAPNNGSLSGMAFAAPFGLATDLQGNLYVADVNNSRVVAFRQNGTWLGTLKTHPGEQPLGVCVSVKGIVAAADRPASASGHGDVEFFKGYQLNNNTLNPYGGATGTGAAKVTDFENCAFDKETNFFADGSLNYSQGGQKIVYLKAATVQAAGAHAVSNSIEGSASYWDGMYVQYPLGEVLSVGGSDPNGTIEIQNFKINPTTGAPGAALPVTALTGYPASSDPFYQTAPNAGGNSGQIYVADYGVGEILTAPVGGASRPGGPVTVYAGLSTVVGVATFDTGQY
jgi:hypothetical protein